MNTDRFKYRATARELVRNAEIALGSLSDGEKRDLLLDNLPITWRCAAEIVEYLKLPLDRKG